MRMTAIWIISISMNSYVIRNIHLLIDMTIIYKKNWISSEYLSIILNCRNFILKILY